MKKLVLLSFFLVLGGCAHHKTDRATPAASVPVTKSEKKSKDIPSTGAVFHVVEPLGVDLVLLHLEREKEERIRIDKTLSQVKLAPGAWQVKGFWLKGKRYEFMNSGQQFVFSLTPKKTSYVGSYIFQCPKVTHQLKELKKMSFFNRYPFKSKSTLCEMIVGSDYKNVNRVWQQLDKVRHQSLTEAF